METLSSWARMTLTKLPPTLAISDLVAKVSTKRIKTKHSVPLLTSLQERSPQLLSLLVVTKILLTNKSFLLLQDILPRVLSNQQPARTSLLPLLSLTSRLKRPATKLLPSRKSSGRDS